MKELLVCLDNKFNITLTSDVTVRMNVDWSYTHSEHFCSVPLTRIVHVKYVPSSSLGIVLLIASA